MKPLPLAQADVLDAVGMLPAETVAVGEAAGLALAEPVTARHDVPPFPNSGMDGYAVLAADVADPPISLHVLEDVPAGSVPRRTVVAGTAIKIMTGAPMPEGADTVVPVEDSEPGSGTVVLKAGRPRGANVRPAGGDLAAGDLVFPAGVRLTAIHLGVLASLGIAPRVARRPVAAIVSTGDEVVPPDTERLAPGAIRDTNRPMLASVLADAGCTVVDMGIVGDDAHDLREAFAEAADCADIVVSSGGVSMGEYDFVKHVLRDLGSVDFWKVAMKPGKPFAFGHLAGTPFFGLPGNPVSVFVSFEQFVRPAVLTMMGASAVFRPHVTAIAGEPFAGDAHRLTFVRIAVRPDGAGNLVARLAGGQGSNMLAALSRSDGLAVLAPGAAVAEGDQVIAEMFSWPESRTREEALG